MYVTRLFFQVHKITAEWKDRKQEARCTGASALYSAAHV
jgi:hypothetical protein